MLLLGVRGMSWTHEGNDWISLRLQMYITMAFSLEVKGMW